MKRTPSDAIHLNNSIFTQRNIQTYCTVKLNEERKQRLPNNSEYINKYFIGLKLDSL